MQIYTNKNKGFGMDYYSSHKLASKGRAEFVRNAFNKWNKQPL